MKAFIALMLLATPVPAAAAGKAEGDSAEATTGSEAPKKEKKICKREATTGTLYGSKRICMTAEQWRARNKRQEDGDMGAITTR